MIPSIKKLSQPSVKLFLLLMMLSMTTISCKKKTQFIKAGAKATTARALKHFATYFFGIAFLMRTEEIFAEKMFEAFSEEPPKETNELGNIIIFNNHTDKLTVDVTNDGRNWSTFEIIPRDSISVQPNAQGLAFISSNTADQKYVQLEPNKEYAVKIEEGKKVVDQIQRNQ